MNKIKIMKHIEEVGVENLSEDAKLILLKNGVIVRFVLGLASGIRTPLTVKGITQVSEAIEMLNNNYKNYNKVLTYTDYISKNKNPSYNNIGKLDSYSFNTVKSEWKDYNKITCRKDTELTEWKSKRSMEIALFPKYNDKESIIKLFDSLIEDRINIVNSLIKELNSRLSIHEKERDEYLKILDDHKRYK